MTKTEVTQLSYDIVGCAIKVHKELGPGLLESVYELCLAYELKEKGYLVDQQVTTKINYGKIEIETPLKVDLLVNETIIIEIKTVEKLLPIHQAQLMTYMKILKKPQGLLINFYTENITKSMVPLINEYFAKLPE
ncbi:GxxExxY protein [Chryseobacterium sp. Ch-15]|uniref:GxxExxY protein n=1 Tax=Chryseobacterium muglaense TaxID=2893752 RepID=A0A9Q3YRS6_9FLAO|nr:GxxExxY protein [Chryseobacterium muglaense]MBD3905009.1 GxxExxY protein [Chryseobacterium muglaense]MCC9035124.1 GxxExxY protein [Chryseobacterium muglaense]MCM2554623.1 GxxExxY protein [Chryseobacterium muglaense]